MVLILGGSSVICAHVRSKLCYLILQKNYPIDQFFWDLRNEKCDENEWKNDNFLREE